MTAYNRESKYAWSCTAVVRGVCSTPYSVHTSVIRPADIRSALPRLDRTYVHMVSYGMQYTVR